VIAVSRARRQEIVFARLQALNGKVALAVGGHFNRRTGRRAAVTSLRDLDEGGWRPVIVAVHDLAGENAVESSAGHGAVGGLRADAIAGSGQAAIGSRLVHRCRRTCLLAKRGTAYQPEAKSHET
jgi:hypothetical protein